MTIRQAAILDRDDMAEAVDELRNYGATLVFSRTDMADYYDGIPSSRRHTASVEWHHGDRKYVADVTEWQLVPDPICRTAWDEVQSHTHSATALADLLYTLRTEYGITERE